MAYPRSELFQWKRKADPLKMRSEKKNNIKDWIKRIQIASDDAVQEVFGGNILEEDVAKEIIPDDEAVYEAQELLDGWLKEKTFDLDKELDYKDENWSSSTGVILNAPSVSSHRTTNTVYDELKNKYLCDDASSISTHRRVGVEGETFFQNHLSIDDDEDIDEALLVQDVLHGMLAKDVSSKIDLGMKPLERLVKDPLPKMNLRHEQVRQRGERRRKANAYKKVEKMSKEDIEQKARQRIVEEERERIKRERLQEKAISLEMEKIKEELAEEKLKRDEEAERKKRIYEEAKLEIQSELRKKREEEIRRKKREEEFRLEIQKEIEKEEVEEMRQYMHILHKHFSAWYRIVLEHRAVMGKVQAIVDWKCKIKAWNAWKAYVASLKSSHQARAIAQSMKEKYRKEQMAIQHHSKKLMRKCFCSLLKYGHYKANKKHLLFEHEEKSKKMAMFLEAAASGELWNNGSSKKVETFEEKETCNSQRDKKNGKERMNSRKHISETSDKHGNYSEVKDKQGNHSEVEKQEKCETFEKRLRNENASVEKVKKAITESRNDSHTRLVNTDRKKESKNKKEKMKKGMTEDEKLCVERISFRNQGEETRGLKDIEKAGVGDYFPTAVSTAASKASEQQSKKKMTKPIHLAMEEREMQRKERRAAVEKEKQRKEEKRLEELRSKEAERLQQEEHEKEEKLRLRREKRMLEAQQQKEKELRLEQIRLKNEMATYHYHLQLLRKYGVEPLKRIVHISKLNFQISDKYRSSLLLKLTFVEWYEYVKELTFRKRKKAESSYNHTLLRRSLHSWQKCRFHMESMSNTAREHALRKRLKRAFTGWQDYVTDERILMWAKESSAEEHNEKRVVKNCFKFWTRYVKLEQEEKVRELRKEEFRKKVQLWLPDYKGGSLFESP